MPKWGNCILCDADVKATPKHVEVEHNMSYEQYKNILAEKGLSPSEDNDNLTSKERKRMTNKSDDEGYKPSTSEQAVSQIAYDSFKSTMQEMSERKQELQQKERDAENKKEELQRRLYRLQQQETEDKRRPPDGGVEEELKDWMIRNYIEDLREDKRKGIEQEVEELKDELRKVDTRIETEIEEKLRKVIKEFADEPEETDGKKGKGKADLQITDESIKSVTALGEQVIKYLQQNQAMKYAMMSGNEDLVQEQVKNQMKGQMLQDVNGMYGDVAGGDVSNMVAGNPQQQQQQGGKSDVKTLKELLDEEEEGE